MRIGSLAVIAGLGISVFAPEVAAQAVAKTFVDVEAGAACSTNKEITSGIPNLGDNGCGWTGALTIGQFGKPVIGPFDYWGIRGRHTSFDDHVAGPTKYDFTDRRTVLDAELGANTGLGWFGGTSRIVAGIRYADYVGDYRDDQLPGPTTSEFHFKGIGPRLGLISSIPLGSSFRYDSQSGVSALFGRHEFKEIRSGIQTSSASNSATVYSIETSSALTYLMGGPSGAEVSLGVRSEYWFGQIQINETPTTAALDRNRHSWGPFARVRVPLQ